MKKIEKLKILETEWEYHTQPDKLMQIAEDTLGMSTKEVEQFGEIKIVKLRSSAWKLDLGVTKENLLKDFDYKTKHGYVNQAKCTYFEVLSINRG